MVTLSTYRTDSVARRMLTAFMPVMAEVIRTNKMDTWFGIGGSASNNTASTIKVPDFDCICNADLGKLEQHHLRLECSHNPIGTVYYRLKFVGTGEQKAKLESFLKDQLSHLVRYSKYKDDPASVPWLVLHEGDWYLNTDNIRILQEGIGEIIGAERSETGAAATAAFPVKESLLLDMYKSFQQRLPPDAASNRFFTRIIPEVIIPYIAAEYRSKSIDFDLVTLISCKPDKLTVDRLVEENGLPKMVEELMRSGEGICLAAKVDKMGLGNKMVDFRLTVSHESILRDFKGSREVLVILKDLLSVARSRDASSKQEEETSTWPQSYHFKSAMTNILKRCEQEDCAEPLSNEALLKETLRETIKAYEDCSLPSFFDPRINLLLDLQLGTEASDLKRKQAIETMRNMLDNYDDLLQECHRRPMALSKFLIGMLKRVLSSDIIDWQEEFPTGPFLNMALNLASLDYLDHSEERGLEANVTTTLLQEAFAILSKDIMIGSQRAFRRSVSYLGYSYATNSFVSFLNRRFELFEGETNCAEGTMGGLMDVAGRLIGQHWIRNTEKKWGHLFDEFNKK